MTVPAGRGRELRAWWATLAAICFLGAGIAYGVTRYTQGELERDATHDAKKLAVEALQPLLVPADAGGPVRGARYDELLASVREHVLAGPINGVRLWRPDGTILFADAPDLVGSRDPNMRDEILAVTGGTSESVVSGDRFRTFTTVRVGDPATLLAAELDRSHGAIVAKARDRWYPWVTRGLVAGGVFVALYVATIVLFALWTAFERGAADRRRRRAARPPRSSRASRSSATPEDDDLPAYMRPGFQEEVQSRRHLEEELEVVRRDRDALRQRVQHLESELSRLRAPREEAPIEPPGELDRLQALARERLGG